MTRRNRLNRSERHARLVRREKTQKDCRRHSLGYKLRLAMRKVMWANGSMKRASHQRLQNRMKKQYGRRGNAASSIRYKTREMLQREREIEIM